MDFYAKELVEAFDEKKNRENIDFYPDATWITFVS